MDVLQERLLSAVSGRTGVPGGFLDSYVKWACGQSDSPPSFHILSGLMALATVAHSHSRIRLGPYSVAPNIFAMAVGTSGRVRKSWSQSMCQRLLNRVCAGRIGASAGSYEALVDELRERPLCTVFEEEFSNTLAGSGSGGSAIIDRIKTGFTKLYDGGPVSNRTRKAGSVNVRDYRLSVAAAISPSYLSDFTIPSDYTGGFLSRWLFAYGERPAGQFRGIFDAQPDPDMEDHLANLLGLILEHCPAGIYEFQEPALALFRPWEIEIEHDSCVAQDRFQGFLNRAAPLALRIAGLVAIDRMVTVNGHREIHGTDDPLRLKQDKTRRWPVITEDDFACAAEIVRAHIEDTRRIVETVEHTKEAKVKARILGAIPTSGFVELAHITEGAGMTKKTIMDPLETLVDEGRVETTKLSSGGRAYRRRIGAMTESVVEATPLRLPELPLKLSDPPATTDFFALNPPTGAAGSDPLLEDVDLGFATARAGGVSPPPDDLD